MECNNIGNEYVVKGRLPRPLVYVGHEEQNGLILTGKRLQRRNRGVC